MTTTTMDTSTNRLVRKIRLRAILFFALALVAGVGAVFLVKLYMDQGRAAAVVKPMPTEEVVVAAVAVPIGTQLERQHLAAVRWPAERRPAGTFSTIEQVVGRSLEQGVVEGEPILASRLADPERGRGMAAILAPGHRAMTVKVDQVVGVAGFVQPGDFVDVITTMKPDEDAAEGKVEKVSKIILQNIRVLAVGPQLSGEGGKPVSVPVVTLDVTPEQSEMLALGSQHGKIQLTMRSRVDQASVPTAGITPAMLLASDEGARAAASKPGAPATATAAAPEPPAKAEVARRPTRRGATPRREHAPAADAKADEKEKPPMIEILRGQKVEQRTLRPSADAK